MSSHCEQHFARMVPSELIELLGSSARQLDPADAQLDLDLRRQQRRAAIPSIRSRKSPADCGRRGDFLPLPHMKEREAGLRLTTTPGRLLVRFLGRCDLSA